MDTLTVPQVVALEYVARRALDRADEQAEPDYGAILNLIKMGLVNADATRLTEAGVAALARDGYPALAEAVDHARNRCVESPITVKWHVGHNDWGYGPSTPPSCHDDVAYARDALASSIGDLVEHLADGCDHVKHVKSCENCRNYARAFEVQNHLSGDYDMGEGVRFELSDGRTLPVVYWAWPVTMDHAENRCNQD